MVSRYEAYIEAGVLPLSTAPSEGTLSDWINDNRLTVVLEWLLVATMNPFRDRETFGIVDSSKVSQVRTAHYSSPQHCVATSTQLVHLD